MANKAKTKQYTKTVHHRRQHNAGVLMSMETECLENINMYDTHLHI